MKTQAATTIIILLVVAALLAVGGATSSTRPARRPTSASICRAASRSSSRRTKPNGAQVTSAELQQAISIMDRRVNGLGVTEAQVQKQATDQISVALPGVTDTKHALAIIGKTAQLEFYDDGASRVAGPSASMADAVQPGQGQTKFTISAADLKALGDPEG